MSDVRRRSGFRLRNASLGVKLALFGAMLTAVVVGGTFLGLRAMTAAQIRGVLVTELHGRQVTLREMEDNDRRLFLQTAEQLAAAPTLRAALAAWRGAGPIAEREATVAAELRTIAGESGADFLAVTDDSGRVVSAAGASVPRALDIAALPALRAALFSTSETADSAFGVLVAGDRTLETAVVPVLVGGYPVGALVIGRRLDRILPPRDDAGTSRVVVIGDTVLESTLPGIERRRRWGPTARDVAAGTLTVAGAEYVDAIVPLGAGASGRQARLYLLRPLAAAIDPMEDSLGRRFLLAGILAVVAVAAGGALLARTTLRPLSRFVQFLQAGSHGDRFALFTESDTPGEISALTTTYNALIESLQQSHETLRHRSVDLAEANRELSGQIVQRERAEHALRESEEQLRQSQKLEALGALAGGVAHDFNNILSIIIGYAEIVQAELEPGSSPATDAGRITSAALRARTLVRQLLAFSRKQILQPQVVDLNHVVSGVQALLRPLIGENVTLDVRLAPDVARILADPVQLEQVLINLAANARDAMPSGGTLAIETANGVLPTGGEHHPLPAGDVVMLSVADTGIGMDAATRARIFEPFFTTKPVGQGTGLGLATVYGIIRQSGGNITVFSEPGAGAIFRCYFPRAASPVDDATPDDMPARTRGAETILVAEDEPELRALMKRALERHGYGVLVAADGADALATAARHAGPIHLLLTDMVMPNLSGRQLAEQLTRERPDLRVLIMSGYSTDAIARQGVVLPHSVFLQKPVSPDALARAVRALLDSSVVSGIA